jgi:hypothetical protein
MHEKSINLWKSEEPSIKRFGEVGPDEVFRGMGVNKGGRPTTKSLKYWRRSDISGKGVQIIPCPDGEYIDLHGPGGRIYLESFTHDELVTIQTNCYAKGSA